jgi:hypothetical protein
MDRILERVEVSGSDREVGRTTAVDLKAWYITFLGHVMDMIAVDIMFMTVPKFLDAEL